MHILTIDNHKLFLQTFSKLLRSFNYINKVYEAETGEQGLELISQNPLIDVVFLDIRMPGMNGFETCNRIMENHPDVNIVILSHYDTPDLILFFIQKGVKGFLTKDVDIVEIEKTLLAIKEGESYFPLHIFEKIKKNITKLSQKTNLLLSTQEMKILSLLKDGLTSKEIASETSLSTKTVNSYRENILQKTRTRNVAQLISWAYSNGLMN